jgi:predicted Na+-dependent transporter
MAWENIERVANRSNPHGNPLAGLASRFLAGSAARGSALLGFGVFGGVLIPPLAHAMNWFITPNVIGLMTLVLLRVDIPAALAHLRRPGRLAVIVAFQMVACPLIAWAAVTPLRLDPGISAGVVIFATGCAATSGMAFARLVGLDPELTLLATLAGLLVVPLSAPPLAAALIGVDLAISVPGFMARLALVVGLPLALSVVARQAIGAARLAPHGPAIDGAVVWLVVLYGFGVMDGLAERIAVDPAWVAQATAAAFAADFGLNAATTLALGRMGWRNAAAAGLMSGNRNMALYLAVLPGAADPRLALFFALCQFPLFLSPFLLRPVYRLAGRLAARPG